MNYFTSHYSHITEITCCAYKCKIIGDLPNPKVINNPEEQSEIHNGFLEKITSKNTMYNL